MQWWWGKAGGDAEAKLAVVGPVLDDGALEVRGDPGLDPVHFLQTRVRRRLGDEMHMISIAMLPPQIITRPQR